MIWLVAVVVAAVVLMALAGRFSRAPRPVAVVDVDADAVRGEDGAAVAWDDIYEVVVLTSRIGRRRTAFSLEVSAAGAPVLSVASGSPAAEPFLAETYHLPGFDHGSLQTALARRERRAVVFSR